METNSCELSLCLEEPVVKENDHLDSSLEQISSVPKKRRVLSSRISSIELSKKNVNTSNSKCEDKNLKVSMPQEKDNLKSNISDSECDERNLKISTQQEKDNSKKSTSNSEIIKLNLNSPKEEHSKKSSKISSFKHSNNKKYLKNPLTDNVNVNNVNVTNNTTNNVSSISNVGNVNKNNSSSTEDINEQNALNEIKKEIEPPLVKVTTDISKLKLMEIKDLTKLAEGFKIHNSSRMSKYELIISIAKKTVSENGVLICNGVIEILQDGFGFIRTPELNYSTGTDNVYISSGQIKKFGIRNGDSILGEVRPPNDREKYFTIVKVHKIGNFATEKIKHNRRINFDELTPIYPDCMIKLEIEEESIHKKRDISMRAIDILAPLGKGQRALIVAPPKTGKTMLLQNIAKSISANYPEMKLIVLLIDERPEEVTDMIRSVKGEVVSSTFDEPAFRHVQLAEIVSDRAKRMVEDGEDVLILLDSITRLARAYNVVIPSSGKVLTGGIDSNALQRPKRFFGAARNIENGGSLTIIATALVETGSRMDEVIFEEFKGTGNCEIVLDRKLAEKRHFPAIDVTRSGTRKEELLLSKDVLSKSWLLRRVLTQMGPIEGMEFLRDKLIMTKNNSDFFNTMNS